MKIITFYCCLFLLGISTLMSAQNQINLNDLLAELEKNHMGAITDVFTADELAVLEAHFASINNEETNFDRRGPKVRLYGPENVGDDFGFIDTTAPGIFNTIGPSGTADFDGAGAIFPGNTNAHLIDNAGNFYEVDIITGQYIPMGTIPPPAGENFTGMEFNPNNGMLFGISTDGTTNTSTLSHIDPVAMTATPVGNTGLRLPVALSIDGNGNGFTYDIDDDFLYQLDMANGIATQVGSLGFNADFGGGMVYDPNTNKTFITSYNPSLGDSQLREVNTDTGLTLVVGTINPGSTSQIAWGGIVNSIDLGVGDNALFGFNFSPNPANDMIQLTSTEAIERIEVYNILGQQLINKVVGVSQGTLDVSNLETGTYLMKVTVNGQLGSYRFIKQ
ncbi:MAG: T9SS type A sorting domain-containing protein [Bacteroidota bacterium]